jgi:hypothetical protein
VPYKDPERKKLWEQQHRNERLTRRRELRRTQEAAEIPEGVSNVPGGSIGYLWLPLLAGAGLAAYSPKFALGAGGVTLLAATYYRKGWQWWLFGALTVLLALVFMKSEENQEKRK